MGWKAFSIIFLFFIGDIAAQRGYTYQRPEKPFGGSASGSEERPGAPGIPPSPTYGPPGFPSIQPSKPFPTASEPAITGSFPETTGYPSRGSSQYFPGTVGFPGTTPAVTFPGTGFTTPRPEGYPSVSSTKPAFPTEGGIFPTVTGGYTSERPARPFPESGGFPGTTSGVFPTKPSVSGAFPSITPQGPTAFPSAAPAGPTGLGYPSGKPAKPFPEPGRFPVTTPSVFPTGFPAEASVPGRFPSPQGPSRYPAPIPEGPSGYPGTTPSGFVGFPGREPSYPETTGTEIPPLSGVKQRPQGPPVSFPGAGEQLEPGRYTGQYEDEGDYSAVPGEPGQDYPIYSEVPQTSFSCDQQPYPGYYADVETRCQAFHICANNRTYDFLCPNGTVFHQEYLVCVWWNQFDCNSAPSLYGINANIYDYSITGGIGQAQYPGRFQGRPGEPLIPQGYPTAPSEGTAQGPSGYPTEAPEGRPQIPGGYPTRPSVGIPSGGYPAGRPAPGRYPTGPTVTTPQETGGYPSRPEEAQNGYPTGSPTGLPGGIPQTPNGRIPGYPQQPGGFTTRPTYGPPEGPSGQPFGPQIPGKLPIGPSVPRQPAERPQVPGGYPTTTPSVTFPGSSTTQPSREYLPPNK